MRLGFAIEHRFLPVELRLVRERRLQAPGGKTAADAPHGGQTGARLLANDCIRSRPVWLGGIGPQKDTRMSAVALGRLPERQAEVFCLHVLEGWEHAEIAKQMQITSDAVGVLLHRARSRLRELLAPVIKVENRKVAS